MRTSGLHMREREPRNQPPGKGPRVALTWLEKVGEKNELRTRERDMSTIQVHEVCKVRNAAVGRAGSGYSLAVFKKANKASARVVVLDASFVPGSW